MYDPQGLYLDPILTAFSVGYDDQQLYGQLVMPETGVNTKSGRYLVYDRSNWVFFASRREPGALTSKRQMQIAS